MPRLRRPALRVEPLESRDAPAVTVQFDYRFDSSGFFADPVRRGLMDQVAAAVTSQLQDSLAAIAPNGGGNTWLVSFFHPATGQQVDLRDQLIPANTILVYPIGAALSGSELGEASTGRVQAQGSAAFLDAVFGRGQPGANADVPTDYAPWGGFLTFNTGTDWSFSTDAPATDRTDFLSVAQHELVHLLGFTDGVGTFSRYISSDGTFTGPNAVGMFGGPVPLSFDGSHWARSVRFQGLMPTMLASIANGEVQRVTALDFAALQDIGWQLAGEPTVPTVPPVLTPPVSSPLWASSSARIAVGADGGDTGYLLGPTLNSRGFASPGGADFTGGVRVAAADVNGDGVQDLIAGTGPGTLARVIIVDGKTGGLLFETTPFDGFTGGVFVAAGDIDRDGKADIAVTPDRGGGPRVAVFRGNGFAVMADFFGIDDPAFRGGARAALGDVDGDGFADAVVSAGFLGGPRIAGFRGSALAAGRIEKLFQDFFAFEPGLRNGAFVALGDVTADGKAELIFGAGPGGGPRVRVIDGAGLIAAGGGVDLDARTDLTVANFFGGDAATRGGIRVGVEDLDGDGLTDLLVGAGDESGTRVTAYLGRTLRTGGTAESFHFDAFPGAASGVYVG